MFKAYFFIIGFSRETEQTGCVFVCVYVCLCVCICVQGIKRENTRLQAALSKKMDYKERTDCNLRKDSALHSMIE